MVFLDCSLWPLASKVKAVLNDNDWATISEVASANEGENYWAVGDCKELKINGVLGGSVPIQNLTVCAFIIGFNHNAPIEGGGRIHFQIGKTATTEGVDICLVDSEHYNSTGNSPSFRMNISDTNTRGWESCYMRTRICGADFNASTASMTMLKSVPVELQSALKTVAKYTNNTGNNTSPSVVTATTDYFFLLSEYEVFGNIRYSNTYEANYQQQYAYYSAGNSKVKYLHNSTRGAARWWLRSPRAGRSDAFACVRTDGTGYSTYANNSLGFAPGFCV